MRLSEVPIHSDDRQLAEDYRVLHEACGQLLIAKPALLSLKGDDRREWLQGQATNDIRLLSPEKPLSFCLCTPTGQLECIVHAWERTNDILLSTPMETRDTLLERVEEMVIMEDVSIDDLTESHDFVSVQGPAAKPWNEFICLPHDRCGLGGFDVWRFVSDPLDLGVPWLSKRAYEATRIEHGIPLFGADTSPRTLPPELGPAFESRHVSYQKGCYTGQEILQRLHSRGHTNREWVGFVADAELDPGASIVTADGQSAGAVTSAAMSPRLGHIGAGMLRREHVEHGTKLLAQTQRGAVSIEVRSFPMA